MSACNCVPCKECGGTGTVWFAFPGPDRGGRYLGRTRSDDLDENESCYSCEGSGVATVCDHCLEFEENEL